jgi:hypothetical protein
VVRKQGVLSKGLGAVDVEGAGDGGTAGGGVKYASFAALCR